jgi:hypothetical protein
VGGVASPSILLVATLAEGALSSFVLNLVPTKKTISLNSSFFWGGGVNLSHWDLISESFGIVLGRRWKRVVVVVVVAIATLSSILSSGIFLCKVEERMNERSEQTKRKERLDKHQT